MKNPIKYIIISLMVSVSLYGQTRYVSKQGSSTYPYTSWASAADSIQKAVDASNEGDSIIVGSGTYEETIILKRGNKLIGMGSDSTIIDTRTLVTPSNFHVITSGDSSTIKGFAIIVSDRDNGTAILCNEVEGQIIISDNKVDNAAMGVFIVNSGADCKRNEFRNSKRGIHSLSLNNDSYTKIDKNIFYNNETAISTSFPENLTIRNNIIITKDEYSRGMYCAISDSLSVTNNLVISEIASDGIIMGDVKGEISNNVIYGNHIDDALALTDDSENYNNVIISSSKGVRFFDGKVNNYKYNVHWDVSEPYINGTPDTTNKELYPMFMNEGEEDYKLQKYSPLIDAGNPEIKDKDGTRSDIGLYGGPYGEEYAYLDLSPKVPVNISADVIGGVVRIMWDRNYESDFDGYIIYRDTLKGFNPGENNKYSSADTAYFVDENIVGDRYYYKITSIDKQQNESEPGEEIEVIISGIDAGDVVYTEKFKLYQNYPNPFNPWTRIMYNIRERGRVIISIMNINGEEIATLVDKELSPGLYEEEININEIRSRISSGVYIYRLMVIRGNEIVFKDSKKMIYLK
ncbi:MAG: NosD domain-containing protein [Melioribacteraceae bacterium]|nr:NosD domain-containing protein [Melioribacteraceae bacterium]